MHHPCTYVHVYVYVRMDVYPAYTTVSADWGRAARLIRAAG